MFSVRLGLVLQFAITAACSLAGTVVVVYDSNPKTREIAKAFQWTRTEADARKLAAPLGWTVRELEPDAWMVYDPKLAEPEISAADVRELRHRQGEWIPFGSMPPGVRAMMLRMHGGLRMPGRAAPSAEARDAMKMIAQPWARFDFEVDGRTVQVSAIQSPPNELREAMKASLPVTEPLPAGSPLNGPQPVDESGTWSIQVCPVRPDPSRSARFGKLALDVLAEAQARAVRERDAESLRLFEELVRRYPGLAGFRGLEGMREFRDLPKNVKEQVVGNLLGNLGPLGFKTEQEALAAFERAKIRNVSLIVDIGYWHQAGGVMLTPLVQVDQKPRT